MITTVGVCLAAAIGVLGLHSPWGPTTETSYLDAAAYGAGFLAVGTEGRMDQIGTDGSIAALGKNRTDQTLSDVAVDGAEALAVGPDGTAVYLSAAGNTRLLDVGTDTALQSVCRFQGRWLIGTEGGQILRSDDLDTWSVVGPGMRGNVTGLAVSGDRCIAVTDQGETATTTDGVTWSVLDYNAYYGETVEFSDIIPGGGMFWAIGTEADGTSVILSSLAGGVWLKETTMVYDGNNSYDGMPGQMTAIAFDGTQAIAVSGTKQALIMPDCTECNMVRTVSEQPVYTVASNGGNVLFAGAQYSVSVMEEQDVRQYQIKAAAAWEKQKNGALMIDVRGETEYAQGHISGSISIPLDQVESRLPAICSDREQELIFYCSSGKRSAAALEKALEMGYSNVYNLGSIADWPYEIIE